jgi:4-amino-4-deoxy-L-arabinose transferase-like glycosyltransferase
MMNRERVTILSLFILAFALRLIYLQEFSQYPTFYHLNIDQEYYNLWAKRIVKEGIIGKKIFEMTPLYAYFLAFIYKFFTTNLYVVRLIQILIGSLSVVFIYKLAFRLVNSQRVAVISGLAAAFYGVFILYDGMIMKPFLAVFFAVLTLYWLAKIEHERPAKFLLPGIFVGLLILVRENAILLIAGIPLCFFIKDGITRFTFNKTAFFIIGTVLMIMPVTMRNYWVSNEFVPITTGGGEVFYMAYYEGSNGYYVPPPFVKNANPLLEHEEFRQEAMRRTGRELTRRESSDYWFNEGVQYIKERPQRLIYLLYRKFIVFWNFYETPDNQNFFFMRGIAPILKLTLVFGTVAPLGILGFFVSLRRWRKFLPIYAFFLVYMVSVLLTFNISRYRVPAVPILIIFAALYLDWLYSNIREWRINKLALSVVLLIILFLGVNYRIDGVAPYRSFFTTEYSKLAKSYILDGKMTEAKSAYRKIIELDPSSYDGYLGFGKIALKEGNYYEAIDFLRKALAVDPSNYRAYFNLAIAYNKIGRANEAQDMLNRAIRINPNIWRM